MYNVTIRASGLINNMHETTMENGLNNLLVNANFEINEPTDGHTNPSIKTLSYPEVGKRLIDLRASGTISDGAEIDSVRSTIETSLGGSITNMRFRMLIDYES